MNSRSRTTGTRKTNARRKKPATIDLKANEVKSSSQSESATTKQADEIADKKPQTRKTPSVADKSGPSTENGFGRSGVKTNTEQSQSPSSSSKAHSAAPEASPKTPDEPPVKDAAPKQRNTSFVSGLIGAAAAVVGLGVIGQFESAQNIPLIGTLYSTETSQTISSEESQRLEGLEARLDKIEEIANAPSETSNQMVSRIEAVEQSILDIEETASSISTGIQNGNGSGNSETAESLVALTSRIESIESQLLILPDSTTANGGQSGERIKSLESRLSAVEASLEANSSQLETINTQTSALQTTIASVKASEKIAETVALNTLGTALENDDSIVPALASLEALTGKSAEIMSLKVLAEEGIPSRNALLEGLEKFTFNVQNPPSNTESGSISERFWANAQNLVSFRSSGPQKGSSPVAILSRVKANLEKGDLAGVLNEWEKLPADISQRGAFWTEMLNKRIEAFALFEKLSSNLDPKAG